MRGNRILRAIRRRLPYLCVLPVLCALGLLVRHWHAVSPNFFNTFFPDAAWTMAVYCGFGLLCCKDARVHFPAALGVSFAVECLQLWRPPFLQALRATVLGGLVLGSGFLWSDLVCYTVGALLCAAAETAVRKNVKKTCIPKRHMVE